MNQPGTADLETFSSYLSSPSGGLLVLTDLSHIIGRYVGDGLFVARGKTVSVVSVSMYLLGILYLIHA